MTADGVDPEVREALAGYFEAFGPGGVAGIADLAARRARYEELSAAAAAMAPVNDAVTSEDAMAPGPAGAPAVRLRVYQPVARARTAPALYYIHGGGMNMGSIEADHLAATDLCEALGCVVASVEYRLAPEHPYPAPQEDCYAGLVWFAANAARFGIDPDRMIIYGQSAGAGLAASTTLMARDRSGPALAFQFLACPMLDDRNLTPSSHEVLDVGTWDRGANVEAWGHLLADTPPAEAQYAVPARTADLAGLPPTYVDVGQVDVFRDEAVEYATRLMQARVPAELWVYPGGVHGTQFLAAESRLGREVRERQLAALRRALSS